MKNRIPYLILYGVVMALLFFALGSCSSLGIASSDDLRVMADRLDAAKSVASQALEVASAVPGWPGVLASVAGTVLAGGAGLNKYRNLTRATDPRVSNIVKESA